MAQISIRKSIHYGISTYGNNFAMVSCAGLLVGALGWAVGKLPKIIAFQLGMAHEQPVPGADQLPQMMARLFDGLGVQWRDAMVSNSPKGTVLIGLLTIAFALFYYWIYLGYAKLLLSIGKSGKVTTLESMFKGDHNLGTVIAATFMYLGGMLLFTGACVTACTLLVRIHPAVGGLGAFLSWASLMYGLMRCMFFPFFILDKNMKALESLKTSWERTEGNVLKTWLFFMLLMFFGLCVMAFVGGFIKFVFSPVISSFVTMVFTTACMGSIGQLSLIHIYRAISTGKK